MAQSRETLRRGNSFVFGGVLIFFRQKNNKNGIY